MASHKNRYNPNALQKLRGILHEVLSEELGPTDAMRLTELILGKLARELNGLVYIGKRVALPLRNAEIIKKHEDGVSRAELAGEYDLTTKMIGFIIRQAKRGASNICLPHYTKSE